MNNKRVLKVLRNISVAVFFPLAILMSGEIIEYNMLVAILYALTFVSGASMVYLQSKV